MSGYDYILVNMERCEYIDPLCLGAGAGSWDDVLERVSAVERLLVRHGGEGKVLRRCFWCAGRWGGGLCALVIVGKDSDLCREIVRDGMWREVSRVVIVELLRFMDWKRGREDARAVDADLYREVARCVDALRRGEVGKR